MLNNRTASDKLVILGSLIALVLVVMIFAFFANIISNFAQSLMPLFAGSLLLVGNRREVAELMRTRQPSAAALNAMIGLSLICFGLGVAFFGGTFLRFVFYLPGMLLLLGALPIALGRPSIYNSYRSWASTTKDAFKRVVKRSPRQSPAPPPPHFPSQTPAAQPTIRLDEEQPDPHQQRRS